MLNNDVNSVPKFGICPLWLVLMFGMSTSFAATPKAHIDGPTNPVPFGCTINLRADGSTFDPDRPITWELKKGSGLKLETFDKGPSKGVLCVISGAKVGKYSIRVKVKGLETYTLDGKTISEVGTDIDDFEFEVAPSLNPLNPTVSIPVLAPITGTLYCIYITDRTTFSQPIAALRDSLTINGLLTPYGAIWYAPDISSDDIKRANLTELAKSIGFPTLIVQTASGEVLYKDKAPTSEAEIQRIVKSVREGKGGK